MAICLGCARLQCEFNTNLIHGSPGRVPISCYSFDLLFLEYFVVYVNC